MTRYIFSLIVLIGCVQFSYALPTGAPVCDVLMDYSNITGMTDRTRNMNSGPYSLTANVNAYNVFEHVEITIKANELTKPFLGLMFTVVDNNGNKVGTFSPDSQVRDCDGQAMSITHSDILGLTSKTLFWIPPEEPVGSVFVLGYVLEGTQGAGASQNFYRFVREDLSALEIPHDDEMIFLNSFE